MLNFSNLNDVEFEYLCKDIMGRLLDVKLQRFAPGRDGGVDLTNDVYKKTIIVQVKHYDKTTVSGLISALKKEVPKVKANNPEQYYICCSKELSPQNKQDIYALFSDYMESSANIISIIEINDFLEEEKNADILRKHFKLWIESTNILTDIFTNDICIDSDVLLSDIKENAYMFVKTSAYDYAISCLQKNNVLIIVGNPGVGKTITSKMIVLYYASLGYRVRYTSDGTDLASLKKALSQSADTKEVILLDDCFGQAYFSMKMSQENELLSLVKYVKINPNKILIMNSRVTIYREANERTPDIVKSLEKKEYKAYILDMANITAVEKTKIFYNHLYFSEVPIEHREDIKKDKRYMKIVSHVNYNPRIIEFVTSKRQYEGVKPTEYAEFIMHCLKNPEQIWKNEYERRLVNVDRILLTTLYSLTNTTISLDIVKKCYEHRLSKLQNIDLSINHFEQAINRLQDSMIKIVDIDGKRMLSVANPSVNDFIAAHLANNKPETNEIIEYSICIRQLKRLQTVENYNAQLKSIFADKSILMYVFESKKQKRGFIACYCAENKVLDEVYKEYIQEFALSPFDVDIFEKWKRPGRYLYNKLYEQDICSFYELVDIICNLENIKDIISDLDLESAVEFVRQVDYLFEGALRERYIVMVTGLMKDKIDSLCSDVPADEYDVDVGSVIEDYMYDEPQGGYIDADGAACEIDSIVEDFVMDEINEYITQLPKDIIIDKSFINSLFVSVSGSSDLVEGYLLGDYDDFLYEQYREREVDNHEIEYIFER